MTQTDRDIFNLLTKVIQMGYKIDCFNIVYSNGCELRIGVSLDRTKGIYAAQIPMEDTGK